MSSEFTGVTFPEQKVTPSDDAVIRRALLPDCAMDGCAFSYSGSTLTMAAGMLMICGRQIRHPSTQNWAVVDATSGFARLVLTIDLTLPATKDVFEQVVPSIEYATARDGFADLIRDDINAASARYQLEACVVSLGTGGITGIVSTLQNLNGQFPYASADAERRLKLAAPVNLLDNSDFRKPVNTNGQTSYELGAWGGSCVDRWLANGIGASVTIAADGLHLSNSIYQSVARQELLSDKTVTFAVKINGTVYCTSGVVRYTNAWGRACTLEVEGIWLEVCMQNDNSLWACIEGTSGTVITVEWAALYEGEYTLETLPEYQPKGYNVELLNCGGLALTNIMTLTEGVHYGTELPTAGTPGRIFFKKVT